jgi:hypothetical protein
MRAFEIIGVFVVAVLIYRGVYVTLLGWAQTRARLRREREQERGRGDGFF